MLIYDLYNPCLSGAEPVADPLRVAPVTSPGELLHSLLAVSHAPAPEFLLSVNVAGFLYVSDVDVTRNTARCPCAPLHFPVFVASLHNQLPYPLGVLTGMRICTGTRFDELLMSRMCLLSLHAWLVH